MFGLGVCLFTYPWEGLGIIPPMRWHWRGKMFLISMAMERLFGIVYVFPYFASASGLWVCLARDLNP